MSGEKRKLALNVDVSLREVSIPALVVTADDLLPPTIMFLIL